MTLYVNGQDINRITFAVLESDSSVVKTVEVGPEQYLNELDAFLTENELSVPDISKIIAVVGPGSATALRASLSILNTLRFVKDVEVIGVEKDPELKEEAFITQLNKGDYEPVSRGEMLVPLYVSGPRITASKKDHLRR